MITSIKHKPVNWVDGMKLSSDHFISADHYISDLIRDTRSIPLTGFNYGLLPLAQGAEGSLITELSVGAMELVEIKVKRCSAITPHGFRIDIDAGLTAENPLCHIFHLPRYSHSGPVQYRVLLTVNPYERIPSGDPDLEDSPPRYPEISPAYLLSVIPASEIGNSPVDQNRLTIAQFIVNGDEININNKYIPPCTSVDSHPALISYLSHFVGMMNDIQLAAFKIMDKTADRELISPLGRNIRLISEKLLDFQTQTFFANTNFIKAQPPVFLVERVSNMAHLLFSAIRMVPPKEREDVLRYFYEWRDVTPGNFEEMLARTVGMVYDHQNIQPSMALSEEFLSVISALWKKLSTLEYIGQRKENIVVAEQQIVQQVQQVSTWTLLD